ncbi:hypothetical protein M9H77_02355 [Catharanthus roseus]|uniref:Uncharacterized protein n=1 Tax=Catharanthus roseus TaxID=4058 RepID=A0ACC0C839_CATRO|nr:hypothetical protein M9H77_02355 [Catharanthus roseus]
MARDYVETKSSRPRMSAMRKLEDFHTEYAKDKHLVVAIESMLMVETTMVVENSFLEDMIVIKTSLLKDQLELRRREIPICAKIFLLMVTDWWDCNCEYRRGMRLKSIETWSLMKQALRIRYGVENHEGQGQGLAKLKPIESSMVKESLKIHAMKEKRRVEQGSFNVEQSVIKSISTLLEEYEFGTLMINAMTYELTLNFAHIFKCSSSYAYLEKQLLDSVARIELFYHDLELLHDSLFFALIITNVLSSCASMWSKIHIFLGSFVKSGYIERVSWFSCSFCGVFYAKLKGEFVKNCNYVPSFLFASMKNLDGFIPSIQLLHFVSYQFEFPYDKQKVLIVDEFLKALLFENIHGFQFYHFYFKELIWLLIF